ncbi:CutC-domain-containing protein [Pseudovirgaria hyperparasitica]|uniref:Copper homeostasis protein cutC homolog n=1 Tax=Pseudovirgaria hyperparasitica TaxID=470096 RepID=A0A6A6W1N6_9PEZI|nr:CutC-domain-containing protein [Pseudovirgaria hyperparasitica]KAF2755986.1 CutC-domain-containing protein [Pseudovirgaria hyperparasitica]
MNVGAHARSFTPPQTTLEICANSLQSALAAEAGGADRIELCSNLEQGGITPSQGLIKHVLSVLGIPVHVLIRPRPGNFVYDNDYLSIMRADIEVCQKLGAHGIAIGVLTADGRVDVEQTRAFVELAKGMSVTFHRAFDDVVDQDEGLEDVISTGCARILTSGGKDNILDGELRLRRLVTRAGGRIVVMPGSGITTDNIRDLFDRTDAREFHASATVTLTPTKEEKSKSRFAVSRKRTDKHIVRKLRELLTLEAREKPNLHQGHQGYPTT